MREWLSGRASPCQGERREFESRLPLQTKRLAFASRFVVYNYSFTGKLFYQYREKAETGDWF